MKNKTVEQLAKEYRATTPNQMYGDELGFIAGFNAAKEMYQPKPRKKKVVEGEPLSKDWADYKFERPAKDNFYVTKVKGKGKIEEVADWWNGYCFMYNNDLITHWKRK